MTAEQPFKPGDRVRHHTGIEGTLAKQHRPQWWTVHWDEYVRAITHHEDTFTPLGEPMNKTFGNAYGTLRVKENGDNGSIYITVDSQGSRAGVGIEDAPAVALAILEAAGFEADIDDASSLANSAMGRLAMRVTTEAAKAKAAADREALEGEALVLLNAHRVEAGRPNATSLDDYSIEGDRWRAVARAARELHGVTK